MTTPDPMPDPIEERLRARLASYGTALEEAAVAPPAARPRRHLIAVDGPVGGDRARRRPPWRGPVGRAAAVLVVLAALAGATWAATRPTEPSTTATTERGWADDDVVRPDDRPSAFAALDGSWPLPPGGSLRYVLDRPADPMTFAAFRGVLADGASCLWFRTAYEDPELTPAGREAIAAMPTWPGHAADGPGTTARAERAELVAAALAGDVGRLRTHLATDCGGSGAGLGLPELGRYWLVPGGGSPAASAPSEPEGVATAIDPTELRGWADIVARLGPDVQVEDAIGLPGGAFNVALAVPAITFSLTIGRVDGPVTLPVTESVFDRGSQLRDGGIEVFVGPVGDDGDTLAQVVGPGGASITLSFRSAPDSVEDRLGDVADLAVDLHAAAWPR